MSPLYRQVTIGSAHSFLSNSSISLMHGTIPRGLVCRLHSAPLAAHRPRHPHPPTPTTPPPAASHGNHTWSQGKHQQKGGAPGRASHALIRDIPHETLEPAPATPVRGRGPAPELLARGTANEPDATGRVDAGAAARNRTGPAIAGENRQADPP